MRNNAAPEGQVLVQYLEPSFGGWSVEFAIGYFDNPDDYTDGNGHGWKMWFNGNSIRVIAYCELTDKLESRHTKETQKDFISKYGEFPNLGSVGE